MRKVLVSAAVAVSALAFAAPAAAQYYPAQPYGYGYNNYGQVRALQQRVDRLEWQINRLDRANAISDRSADTIPLVTSGVVGVFTSASTLRSSISTASVFVPPTSIPIRIPPPSTPRV